MIEKSLADEVGLKGSPDPLHLRWTGNVSRVEEQSCMVKLEISGKQKKRRFNVVNARTVEELELPVQSINPDELINNFPYLKGLNIDGYDEARPQLLIGLENLYLSTPLKIREGARGQPIATKTRLGWCVYGGASTKPDDFRGVFHVSRMTEDRQLHDLVKQYFLTDSLGVTPLTTELESAEDKRARQILESTTRRVPGGFETGLVWRCNEVHFPNSYPMAVDAYLEKGYARIATKDDLCSDDQDRIWFLPLGVVINPKKPQKLRLIWDAAAQVKGTSFNSMMLKGPDLLTPLTSVQYRFRQRRVAVTGDIREMYHQFKIALRDQKSQVFLHRKDSSEEPVIYVMNVGIFGAACSPCSAQYIKNLNAKEHALEFPNAAEAIINSHYVDDFLNSGDTVEEVIRLAEEVRYVHSQGGFEIRNFMSNCREVLEGLGERNAAKEMTWNSEESNVAESVLGIRWLPQSDELTLSAYMPGTEEGLLDGSVRPTKRQILKTVMSLYDPLGFFATYVIQGKIIIQDLWRANCDWDDLIDDGIFGDWKRWINLLPKLNDVRIPRSYFGDAVPEDCQPLQLHTFVDGSSTAYACVVYICFIYAGQPHCALIGAKAKVAPIKTLSIPRLELQAAILGTRLSQSILENHQLPIHQRFYWTDSSTVLHWINSDSRRYLPYVACRIGEILTSTNPSEWKKVPTMQNVADKATKWGNGPCFDPEDPWYRGPQFLWGPEEFRPEQNWKGTDAAEELRPVLVNRRAKIEPVIDVKRFSRWEKLQRTVAYVLKFGGVMSEDTSLETPINSELLCKAEVKLWKMVQLETFPEELAVLQSRHSTKPSGAVPVSSPLYKLSAFIDEEGLVRMDGRIGAAPNLPIEAKYPVILAPNHPVTFLFVDFYHRRCHHRNQETVVNELRQLVYIPGLRNLVRKVAARCQMFKVYNASLGSPKMGPLPRARLEAFLRPFTYTGLASDSQSWSQTR
ncbi:uncharacterized protein LOC135698054 [Ochlerotatus camptorhynchus]|uniref:uncharacterized protein LOC135698054 n=1 Tax=Ochlerotatus camptorhynchus TaxID=644619 RepID=UPI0031CF9428